MQRLPMILPILLLAALPARGMTVSSDIAEDTAWTAADSPVRIEKDVAVKEGVTLTVEPAVRIELGPGVTLSVAGMLVARGKEGQEIVFAGVEESGEEARWKSIRFLDSAVDATFEAVDDYAYGSIVEHCRFQHGTKALHLSAASPYIHECTFADNRTEFQADIKGGAAILVEGGSSARIRDCTFESNVADGFAYGGAVYVEAGDPILQDNVFTDNTAIYGGALCTNLTASPIVGNVFDGNRAEGSTESKGGAVALVSTVSAVMNNEMTGNRSVKDGGGLHVCVDCHPHATPFILDNTITGNECEDPDPAAGAGGVGAGFLRMMADNNLHGNTRDGKPADFGWYHPVEEGFPDWARDVSVAHNWWGTTDTGAIAATITDAADIDGSGNADPTPALTAPVAGPIPRVTVTTRRLRYEAAGEPMPVFLTLYNPGAETTLELRILAQADSGPAVPFAGPIDFPGIARSSGAYLLTMPENSVFFAVLLSPLYAPETTPFETVTWHAALYDPGSGKVVGRVSSIRTQFVKEVTP